MDLFCIRYFGFSRSKQFASQDKLLKWRGNFQTWQRKQKEHAFPAEDKKSGGEDEPDPPVYANFGFDEWVLLQLRFELVLLIEGFKHDVDDPERPGVHEQHLAFYFSKYHKKQLVLEHFGVNSNQELLDLVKDLAVPPSWIFKNCVSCLDMERLVMCNIEPNFSSHMCFCFRFILFEGKP